MDLRLGCIADDITGASDVSLMLAEHGMSSCQLMSATGGAGAPGAESAVFALKSRTAEPRNAVEQSLAAARWLLDQGASQLLFKYCSTFDSTPRGNIGPVTDALMEMTGASVTLVCPAFPETGRTIRQSNLFVDGELLERSSMRNHPLTPMRNSNLLELMDAQTRRGASAAISLETVREGADAVRKEIDALGAQGFRYLIPDIEENADLQIVGQACKGMPLVTGASGIAMGLAANFKGSDHSTHRAYEPLPTLPGHALVLAGSCSTATRAQVKAFQARHHAIEINPLDLAADVTSIETLAAGVGFALKAGPVLVHSSAAPEAVERAQRELGAERAASLVEQALSSIASHLHALGCRKFITAGGETSGAVSAALGLGLLHTGPRIAAGVPWMVDRDNGGLVIAFKSGNFGGETFFLDALEMLP